MVFCNNCGASNPDGTMTCTRCGAPLQAPVQQGSYQAMDPMRAAPYAMPPKPEPVPTGGLIAWAIITLLLCTIPGIVALVNASGINSAMTVEEQQKKISTTKTWCLVGTILGGLALIFMIIGGLAQ